jgi:Predicted ABC-type exoprotein transport system, permease component
MQAALDWEKMIATEQYRLYRLYRFFNLFTDVPEISAQVKRRKGLDWCLNKISYQKDNVYLYLYARRLIRGTEFSSLYLRLTVLGGVLLCFVADRWFALGIGGLFIYLIGFQLLPLYNQFQYVVTTQLYPITTKQKTRAMQQLLRILLAVTFVVFSVIRLFFTHSLEDSLVIVGYLVITLIFLQWYVPYRLKKMAD